VSTPRIAIGGVVRSWDAAERTGVNGAYVRSLLAAGGVALLPEWARRELRLPTARTGEVVAGGLGRVGTGVVRWAMAGVAEERAVAEEARAG